MNHALQYHLYRYPLYKFVGKDGNIRVAILGFGDAAQKFLDLTLQYGQVCRGTLYVHVFADCAGYDDYMTARPALSEFFSVDKISNPADTYGHIFFDRLDDAAKKKIVDFQPHYVFIALNDEQKNFEVALDCKKLFGKACISFIASSDAENVVGLCPVTAANDPQLERQAFNAHLIWEKNLCVDFAKVKQDFMEPYNHDASIAMVASLKYQLYAWGIDLDLDAMTFTAAAKKFMELSTDSQMQVDFMYAEHKRWVTEKICNGYSRRAVADCNDGNTRDKLQKSHVCLVRCRADRMLRDKFSRADWDSRAIDELDDLDRVSVEWHRLFTRQAVEIRAKLELVYKRLEKIRSELGDLNSKNFSALVAFNDWKVCFDAIFNVAADSKILLRYKSLSQNFRAQIQDVDLLKKFDLFEQEIVKPLRLSMDCRDFKDEESNLLAAVPFILTYDSEKICLVIPFSDGDDLTRLFANLASATVINPAKILYLAFCRNGDDFRRLKKFLKNIAVYMDKKNLQACVKVLVAYCGEDINFELDVDGRITFGFAKVYRRENPAPEIVNIMRQKLSELATPDCFVALELNDTAVSNQLAGAGLYGEIPAYSFDSVAKKFVSVNNCEIFGYIGTANVFLTANDLTALRGSFGWIGTQPALSDEDCLKLWDRYCADKRRWKDLCAALKRCDTAEDNLKVVGLKIPETYAEDTLKLLKFLSDNRYILNFNSEQLKISFIYGNRIIKDLLTNAGRMLEIFVYHELKKHIHYDDLITGFEPHWHQDIEIKNELDLLIIKGFVTVLIECKATSSIGSEVYFKVRGLADKFTVNPIIIIVVSDAVKEKIENQKKRGEDMKIITISDPKDIARRIFVELSSRLSEP